MASTTYKSIVVELNPNAGLPYPYSVARWMIDGCLVIDDKREKPSGKTD